MPLNSNLKAPAHSKDGQALPTASLRSRVGAMLAAGCLTLSLCPVVALAAPPDQNGAPQGGNPPAMQQGAPEGQAPEGQAPGGEAPEGQAPDGQQPPAGEMPDGQAPEGQAPDGQTPDGQAPDGQVPDGQQPPMGQPKDDALGDQVRQALTNDYGIEISLPDDAQKPGEDGEDSQQGKPEAAPELPEGAVNIQQVIDSVRDIFLKYGSAALSSQISDSDFASEVKDYAVSANEKRLADFASNAAASEGAAPSGSQPSNGQPSALPEDLSSVDSTLMKQAIALVMDAFGYTVNA